MNTLEIASELTAPIGTSGQSTYAICEQAATMLRRQHEAIQKLRGAAKAIIDYGNSYEAARHDWPEWDEKYDKLEQAIKDTEALK